MFLEGNEILPSYIGILSLAAMKYKDSYWPSRIQFMESIRGLFSGLKWVNLPDQRCIYQSMNGCFFVVNVGKYIGPMDAMGMVGFDVLCIYVLFGYSFFSGALTVSFREGFWGQKPHRIQPRQARRKVCSTSVVTDKSDLEKTLGLIWMWGHHENHASHNKVSQEEVQKVR